jgi:hypothetical protein
MLKYHNFWKPVIFADSLELSQVAELPRSLFYIEDEQS